MKWSAMRSGLLMFVLGVACGGSPTSSSTPAPGTPNPASPTGVPPSAMPVPPSAMPDAQTPQTSTREALDARRAALPKPVVLAYAARVAPMLVGRSLSSAEREKLDANGGAALPALIDAWTKEEGFSNAAREWISTKLKASGIRNGINLNLPGNLAAYLAKNRRSHGELLTADYCINDAGDKTSCDTGAPFAAGVLATRAFLINNASRFNLKRARTVLRTFGCKDYPMPSDVQPPLARDVLIPLFQKDKVEGDASGTFGNGFACYTCHSQFGAHAQPFVKFDAEGKYIAAATGQQDPAGEQGRSTSNLFTSHMIDPAAAQKEASQVFGREVDNLRGMAESYTASEAFWDCSAAGLLGYVFGLAESVVFAIPKDVLRDIVTHAREKEAQPSLAALSVEAFSHPAVVRSFEAP
jgi:hypothetical protein